MLSLAVNGKLGERWASLLDWNVLAPVLAAIVGGVLAMLGGYLAGCQSMQAERSLREQERQIASLGAARLLDSEFFGRARLLLNAFGAAHPPGTITESAVAEQWTCAARALEGRATFASCRLGRTALPSADDRIEPIAWALEDRRLIAWRVSGGQWFRISTALNRWSELAGRYRTVGALRRSGETSMMQSARVLSAIVRARDSLVPYVRRHV